MKAWALTAGLANITIVVLGWISVGFGWHEKGQGPKRAPLPPTVLLYDVLRSALCPVGAAVMFAHAWVFDAGSGNIHGHATCVGN